MIRKKKRNALIALLLAVLLMALSVPVFATEAEIDTISQSTDLSLTFPCKSALLMEASTGKILFEQNADEALPPASVTKVMTLLLVMEAIEAGKLKYGDSVRASANACSMGGSQIYPQRSSLRFP